MPGIPPMSTAEMESGNEQCACTGAAKETWGDFSLFRRSPNLWTARLAAFCRVDVADLATVRMCKRFTTNGKQSS
jgi:hypothetical protein